MSESRRRAVNDGLGGALTPRLNNKEKGAIVIVMRGLTRTISSAHVLEQGGF
jgi:hypothetical protein